MLPTVQEAVMTAADFEAWAMLSANRERHYEFVAGEIVPMVVNSRSSEIAARIIGELYMYLKTHRLGRITGADGGYQIGDERYIPDAAFVSYARQPEPYDGAYNPTPPDLAVEVVSPTDRLSRVTIKAMRYVQAGVTLWLVYPEDKEVAVFAPQRAPQLLGEADTLTAPDLLPDFRLPVKTLFEE